MGLSPYSIVRGYLRLFKTREKKPSRSICWFVQFNHTHHDELDNDIPINEENTYIRWFPWSNTYIYKDMKRMEKGGPKCTMLW